MRNVGKAYCSITIDNFNDITEDDLDELDKWIKNM